MEQERQERRERQERERTEQQEKRERQRTDKEKRKKRERKERNMAIRIGVGMASSLLTRQQSVSDQATRSMMFVDKLLLLLDGGLPAMQALQHRFKLPDDIMSSIEQVGKLMRVEVNKLMQWIQKPHYSPDHPYGQHLMQGAKAEFHSLSTPPSTTPQSQS